MTNKTSPVIQDFSWGSIVIEGGDECKDAKLWPGGARVWDWNETGTHHDPGVQPEDVKELIDNGAKVIILSRGQEGRLKIKEETKVFIEESGASYEVYETAEAVTRYNQLAKQNKLVGALIHSTC